jgi:hypothetical protein
VRWILWSRCRYLDPISNKPLHISIQLRSISDSLFAFTRSNYVCVAVVGCQCASCYLLDHETAPGWTPPPKIAIPANPIPGAQDCYRQLYHNGDMYEGEMHPKSAPSGNSKAGEDDGQISVLLVRKGHGEYTFSSKSGGLKFVGVWDENRLVENESVFNVWWDCTREGFVSYLFLENALLVRYGGSLAKSGSYEFDKAMRRVTATVPTRHGVTWMYDLVFAVDGSTIESGHVREAPTGNVWRYGTEGGNGELEYRRTKVNSDIFAVL